MIYLVCSWLYTQRWNRKEEIAYSVDTLLLPTTNYQSSSSLG